MKRLLFISHSHKLEGGAELSLLATVKAVVCAGYYCHVILPKEGSFADALETIGIEYTIASYTWSAMSSYDSDAHLSPGIALFNADSIIHAYEHIADLDIDLVITNTIMPPWYAYAAKSLGVPNIMMIRESYDKRNSTRLLPVAEEYLDNINHVMDYVLYNSQYTRTMYEGYITKPASDIYYPVVDIPEESKHLTEQHLTSLPEQVSIITPGSIVEHKNQLELLEAAAELQTRGVKNFHVTLMGYVDKKGYIDTLKEYIQTHKLGECVSFQDFSNKPLEEISKHQIVVVPSRSEAFGRVTLEGQLLGKLVIGCDTGGTLELIDHQKTGLLYHGGAPSSLADQLAWVLNNHKEASSIAKRGQEDAKRQFLTDAAYSPMLNAIESTLSLPRSAKRIPFYDPVYALIQRNLHVNSILGEYATALEDAKRQIEENSSVTRLASKKAHTKIKSAARKVIRKK